MNNTQLYQSLRTRIGAELAAFFRAVVGLVLWGLLAAAVVWVGAMIFAPDDWTKFQLASKYGVHMENVTVAKMPRDCDFDWAPIGTKGCFYEKQVHTVQTKYDDDYGFWMVSFDGGPWTAQPKHDPPPERSVSVTWLKEQR